MKTKRLSLRCVTPEDAQWLAQEIAQPQVHRWLTEVPHPYTVEDAEWFVAQNVDNPWFRIIEAQGQRCGSVSTDGHTLEDGLAPGLHTLGFWLATSAHGQGYMTEAAGALVDAAFNAGASAVDSGWIEGNDASENVLTKLGFTRTGEVRETLVRFYAETRPVIRVRLTRDDWAARTAPSPLEATPLEPGRTSG